MTDIITDSDKLACVERELKMRLELPLPVESATAVAAAAASAATATAPICPSCQTSNDNDAQFCKKCGSKLG